LYRILDQVTTLLHIYLRTGLGDALSAVFQVHNCIPNAFSRIKQAYERLCSEGDWMKHKHLEDNYPSPSETDKNFSTHQGRFPILCHRPPNLSGLHVTLQVEAFARFLDVYEPPSQYNTLAVDLMMSMSGFFSNESDGLWAY
jgi:hypothetical protein